LEKLLSLSYDGNSLLNGGYSLPFQRIKGADVGAKMGNPKGAPFLLRQGPRLFRPVYGKEYTPDSVNSELPRKNYPIDVGYSIIHRIEALTKLKFCASFKTNLTVTEFV
jgi:hypothetical protein